MTDIYSMTKADYDREVIERGHPPTWTPSAQHRAGQETRPLDCAPLGRKKVKPKLKVILEEQPPA